LARIGWENQGSLFSNIRAKKFQRERGYGESGVRPTKEGKS